MLTVTWYWSPLAAWTTTVPVTEAMVPRDALTVRVPDTTGPLMSALIPPLNTSLISDQVMVTDGACDDAVAIVDAVAAPATSAPR